MSGVMNVFIPLVGASSKIAYWINVLASTTSDYAQGVALDSGGSNVYITGRSNRTNSTPDILTAMYNSGGTIQWQQTLYYNTSTSDSGDAICVDSSGNAYVTGLLDNNAKNDMALAKYTNAGANSWYQVYGTGTSFTQFGYCVGVESGASNVYTGGQNYTAATTYQALITKWTSSGTLTWQRTLGTAATSGAQFFGMAVDSSNNIFVTGTTGASTGVLLVKYDSSGNVTWQVTVGTSTSFIGRSVAVDSSGNIFVVGTNGAGILIIKFDSSGTVLWSRTLGTTANEIGYGVALDSSGNVYLAGRTGSTSQTVIAKYNTSGTIQWQRTMTITAGSGGLAIAVDQSNSAVYVAGYTGSNWHPASNTTADMMLIKVPGDGTLTGTYGSYTYASSALTDTSQSYTSTAGALGAATPTHTTANTGQTTATSTLTSTKTTIQ